jgi:glutathione S-transferase
MSLVLYYHPLASFCHKVLIALYENETPFVPRSVDLMDPNDAAAFFKLWPVGKMPVLRDEARDHTIAETSIIIEYLDRHYPGASPLLPVNEGVRLDARLWDRFFDLYVQVPMQKIVTDRIRPDGCQDPHGVGAARHDLQTAYGMIEREMAGKTWAAGEAFSIADCAAAPALFYAGIVMPFSTTHPRTAAYFERLLARSSVKRVIAEAQPYFGSFPCRDQLPARFAPPA